MRILKDEDIKSIKDTISQMKIDKLNVKASEVTQDDIEELLENFIEATELIIEQAEYIKENL